MKVALITPVPELERMVSTTQVHLLVPSVLNTVYGQPYREFYKERRTYGDLVILDNGAWSSDGGNALPFGDLLRCAAYTGANEVVLPDSVGSRASTCLRTEAALAYLETRDGGDLYRSAGSPRLMIVPQGKTEDDWKTCLRVQREAFSRVQHSIRIGDPVIGVSKFYGGEGVRRRIEHLDSGSTVHLLGWAGDYDDLVQTAGAFPWIRSVDSARPVTYAKQGRRLDDRKRHVGRDADFFYDAVMGQFLSLPGTNLQLFREAVGDEW